MSEVPRRTGFTHLVGHPFAPAGLDRNIQDWADRGGESTEPDLAKLTNPELPTGIHGEHVPRKLLEPVETTGRRRRLRSHLGKFLEGRMGE